MTKVYIVMCIRISMLFFFFLVEGMIVIFFDVLSQGVNKLCFLISYEVIFFLVLLKIILITI